MVYFFLLLITLYIIVAKHFQQNVSCILNSKGPCVSTKLISKFVSRGFFAVNKELGTLSQRKKKKSTDQDHTILKCMLFLEIFGSGPPPPQKKKNLMLLLTSLLAPRSCISELTFFSVELKPRVKGTQCTDQHKCRRVRTSLDRLPDR